MKKIYYLQKHEVELGDIIEYNGIRALVTEGLIDLNPELFKVEEHIQPIYFKALKGIKPFTTGRVYKQVDSTGSPTTIKLIADDNEEWTVYNWQSSYLNNNCFELTTKEEWDKQELLDEATRRYPIGTMINSKYGIQKVLSDKPFIGRFTTGTIQINTDQFPGGMTIYTPENGWVEILPLKFTTEDGVNIYGDMKTYLVPSNDNDITSCRIGLWDGNSAYNGYKYFYHKENALAYIEKHKEKTLEDYENMLLRANIDSINAREVCWFYHTLKGKEPKLYYTNILQLIADDLNDGWVADFTNYDEKWCVTKKTFEYFHQTMVQGVVHFKTKELAEKAKILLGNKINYLFN